MSNEYASQEKLEFSLAKEMSRFFFQWGAIHARFNLILHPKHLCVLSPVNAEEYEFGRLAYAVYGEYLFNPDMLSVLPEDGFVWALPNNNRTEKTKTFFFEGHSFDPLNLTFKPLHKRSKSDAIQRFTARSVVYADGTVSRGPQLSPGTQEILLSAWQVLKPHWQSVVEGDLRNSRELCSTQPADVADELGDVTTPVKPGSR